MDGPGYSDERAECKVCGRCFAPEVLKRHQNICKKATDQANKRKVFDSSKQRATEDLSVKQIKQAQKKEIKPAKTHWREKHQDFIDSIRNARQVDKALSTGGPLPPPPPPSINPDYVQCPHCSRRFNEKAATRHIAFCQEQSMRLPKNKPNAAAQAKQNTRLNYQAPKPKAKASPTTSSPSPASGGGRIPARGASTAASSSRTTPGARAAGTSRTAAAAPRGRAGGPTGVHSYEQGGVSRSNLSKKNKFSSNQKSPIPQTQRNSSSGYDPSQYFSQTQQNQYLEAERSTYKTQYSKASCASPKNVSREYDFLLDGDVDTHYDSYLEAYRDSSSSSLNSFPDHFNRRYSGKESLCKSKNVTPSTFHHLNNTDLQDLYEEDWLLHANDTTTRGHQPPTSSRSVSEPIPKNVRKNNTKSFLFCHQCGSEYPVASAKFCCECGAQRGTSNEQNYGRDRYSSGFRSHRN